MQKDGSLCKYVHFTQRTCTNTVYVMFTQKFFQKKKKKQSNIHWQTVHPTLVLLSFLWKHPLVPSWTGSFQRATAVQLSYGKRSSIQGQQSHCHPLTHCRAPDTQPAHIHVKCHSFLDTRILHSPLTGPYCCPSLPILLIIHIFPWGSVSISDAGTTHALNFCYNQNWNVVLKWLIQTSPGICLPQLTGQK